MTTRTLPEPEPCAATAKAATNPAMPAAASSRPRPSNADLCIWDLLGEIWICTVYAAKPPPGFLSLRERNIRTAQKCVAVRSVRARQLPVPRRPVRGRRRLGLDGFLPLRDLQEDLRRRRHRQR